MDFSLEDNKVYYSSFSLPIEYMGVKYRAIVSEPHLEEGTQRTFQVVLPDNTLLKVSAVKNGKEYIPLQGGVVMQGERVSLVYEHHIRAWKV